MTETGCPRRSAPGPTGSADSSLIARRTRCGALVLIVVLAPAVVPRQALAGERRIVVGEDGRHPLGAAASVHSATGRIECGGVRGVGQVTGRGDTVTSAAHVFFDEAGRSRAEAGRCVFTTTVDGSERTYALAPDREACGSASPYGSAGRHDWAVARLEHPIPGVVPYGIGGPARVGDTVVVIAYEHGGLTAQTCRIRDVVSGEDARELRTDCTGFDGMSGAAYLTPGKRARIVGLHVGIRSRHPDAPGPYAADHHTFGTALDGAFARTLRAATR